MVNSGAIATTSLVPGETAEAKWENGARRAVGVRRSRAGGGRGRCTSRRLAANLRNEGIAHLMYSYERLWFDPDEATDVYTRQCSLLVTAQDLAAMGATLANGGVNPLTGERVIAADHCQRVLAVMVTCGLYEHSGEWLYDIGLPGKSGVGGGIVTVSPGKGGLGTLLAAARRGRQQRARPPGHGRTCRASSASTCSCRRRRRSGSRQRHPAGDVLAPMSGTRACAPRGGVPRGDARRACHRRT